MNHKKELNLSINSNIMEHKSGCIVCGHELVYFDEGKDQNCSFCKKDFKANVNCPEGHFICDECHGLDAVSLIENYCLSTSSTDPFEMVNYLMSHPQVKMHGPEHHYMVPAVLITAYFNSKGEESKIKASLKIAKDRSAKIPGGFCGTHGNCGAGVGAGIFVSIVTGSTPLSGKEWKLSNLITSKCLYDIAMSGGPRCCKRNTFLSLSAAIEFSKDNFNIEISCPEKTICKYFDNNKQCLRKACKYYKNQ